MDIDISDLLTARFDEKGSGHGSYNCWTLCQEVARRAGEKMISFAGWVERLSERDCILRNFSESKQFERLTNPEPFCLIGFLNRKGKLSHIGIVLKDCKSFIHIRRKIGVKIDRLDDPDFKDRIYGFYKYVEHSEVEKSA